MNTPIARSNVTWMNGLVALLIVGYLSMRRSFAHLGVSPVYLGEIALIAFVVGCPRAMFGLWVNALRRPALLSGLAWCIYLGLGYGMAQCIRGIGAGYDPMMAAKTLVFNVYPFFLFAGLWVGVRHAELLPKLIRLLAWCHGIYGVAYIVLLSPLGLTLDADLPDAVVWFGQPIGAAIVLLGLLSFERRLGRMWLPLLLNAFVLMGMQVRAQWLGFAAAVLLWSCLAGRLSQALKLAVVVVGILVVGLIADFRIPAPAMRGGEFSTRSLVGRAIATVDTETAAMFMEDPEIYSGTVSWRADFWRGVVDMVHETPARTLFGPGYGFPIWDCHTELDGEQIRSPHNVFVFALGYTGWIGVGLFCALQLALAALLWRAYRLTGQPFGICLWILVMIWATFDNFFEAPFGAIPCFLLFGMAIAPLLANSPDIQAAGAEPPFRSGRTAASLPPR